MDRCGEEGALRFEIADPGTDVGLQTSQLHQTEGGSQFRWLEIVPQTLRTRTWHHKECPRRPPRIAARCSRTRRTAMSSGAGCRAEPGLPPFQSSRFTLGGGPGTAQLITCNFVEAFGAAVRSDAGAGAAERRAEGVGGILDHQQSVRARRGPCGPGRVGFRSMTESSAPTVRDERAASIRSTWMPEGVRFHIHKRGHQPGPRERCHRGGKRERRRDDFRMPRAEVWKLDREIVRARARVHHDAVALPAPQMP